MLHVPVMLSEVLEYLDPKPNENFIDCTVGQGGHALGILERTAPNGKVLGLDLDAESLKELESRIKNHESSGRIILINGNFADIEKIVSESKFGPIHGVLMDLGWSSWQLEQSERGLSFLKDEPLDMRLNRKQTEDAADIVNAYSGEELENIFRQFGEERFAGRIARAIVASRKRNPITRTKELVEVILHATPAPYHRGRLHPATRTFQALRIAVNEELENLQKGLSGALEVLAPGGRIAVIAFHSLEDRIVKNIFRDGKRAGVVEVRTKKPIVPSDEETADNPRARSAKLRVAVKK